MGALSGPLPDEKLSRRSRATSPAALVATLPGVGAGEARANAGSASQRHFEAALPHLAADYAGEHWLASFALLALLADR